MPASDARTEERDLEGYGARPPVAPWPPGLRVAVSIAVHYVEGAEIAFEHGDGACEPHCEGLLVEAGAREFATETMFEYGARCGIWRLLGALESHGVPATFFCCGLALERNPDLARRIVDGGHEIACHGYRYRSYIGISEAEQRADIERGLATIERLAGVRPVGFACRQPSPATRRLLLEIGGVLYDCDGYDDDLPHPIRLGGRSLIAVPASPECSDERFWPLPNNSGFTSPEDLYRVLVWNLDRLVEEGRQTPRLLPVALRPHIAGRPAKAQQIWRFLSYARTIAGVRFLTRARIAELWARPNATASG